jgi:hypothetical protein
MKYEVKIRKINNDDNPDIRKEIWANIVNQKTGEIIKRRIWWEDNKKIFHDESYNIPPKFRDLVDNAWIEQSRKW